MAIAPARHVGRQGKPREVPTSGSFGVWLVVEGTDAACVAGSSSDVIMPHTSRRVFGLSVWSWDFRPAVVHASPSVVRGPGAGDGDAGPAVFGNVEYMVRQCWQIEHAVDVADDFDLASLVAGLVLSALCRDCCIVGDGRSVAELENVAEVQFNHVFLQDRTDFDDIVSGPLPMQSLSVQLGRRINWASLVREQPPKASVNRWRRESGIGQRCRQDAAPPAEEGDTPDVAAALALPSKRLKVADPAVDGPADPYEVPGGERLKDDPLRHLDAVAFSVKLKARADFSDALDEAHIYNWSRNEEPPARNRTLDPDRTAIARTKAKTDVVGCLVQRRLFAAEVAADNIASIHCFSDASPVVGAELQGMLVDTVHRDESVRRITLPGCTLRHGHTDAINKCIAFLWAVWLVVGPAAAMLRVFVRKVRSFTTDFGSEILTCVAPDVLDAFMAWIAGADLDSCRLLVHLESRLFARCLRIVGWNHTLSSIMVAVAKDALTWPDILEKTQSLCTMLRNETWRAWIAKAVKRHVPDAERRLRSFTATTAKLRFSTIVVCFRQLVLVRDIMEGYVREALFADAQDRNLIQNAVNACRDQWYWKYVARSLDVVFDLLEGFRRWGIVSMLCRQAPRSDHSAFLLST